MTTTSDSNTARTAILAQLGSITAIARGTLAEEFRERPASEGSGTVRLGPYFKHQVWEGGRNISSRIPASCVDRLRGQMDDAKRFDSLVAQLAALAIAEGAAQRAALAPLSVDADAKKNSAKHASRNATARPKHGSTPSSPGSRRKASRS
jgi:hypothetical protein